MNKEQVPGLIQDLVEMQVKILSINPTHSLEDYFLHLPSLYHFSSAVVCPSVYEGFGIPVMEAMCSSAAVLASDISSLPEVLGPGGIRFDPYEPEAIAAALLSVLTMSPDEAANYRKRGRQHALAHLARVANTDLLSGTPVSSLVEVS